MIFLIVIMAWANLSTELLQERFLFGQLAKKDLITFARLTSPLASDPLNPRLSRYDAQPYHHFIATKLHRFESSAVKRLNISLPYRHGKTELAVRRFVPWLMGRHPEKSIIVVTHTDSLAWEHGRDCRNIFLSGGYRMAFGGREHKLRDDSQARDRLQLVGGGVAMFTGRGGLGGGFGADWIIFDDFFKNAEEAQSQATRDHAWNCYISDCKSRLNESSGGVLMIGTRRNEDDVQGRILDETNPHYDPVEAAKWESIRLPALAEVNDPMGRKADDPLWPERFPFEFWNEQRTHRSDLVRMDFQTQAQCNPAPAEGTWFKKSWLKTYKREELPKNLRIYVASDHAYRIHEKNDFNCLLVAGMDPTGEIWILPDTIWKKCDTAELTDDIFKLIDKVKPAQWWAARDAISGSILPLLKRRMQDSHQFFYIDDSIAEKRDLVARSNSIRGLMAFGMVHWPVDWPMCAEAHKQLLSFPGRRDDLVAALAMLGMGLDKMVKADGGKPSDVPKKGTMAWHSYGQDAPQQKGWT